MCPSSSVLLSPRTRRASHERLHLDFAIPNLRVLDLDGDLSPRQGDEFPGLVGVGLLQRSQHIDEPSIHDVGSPVTLPNHLNDIPPVENLEVAIFYLSPSRGLRIRHALLRVAGDARTWPAVRTRGLFKQTIVMSRLHTAYPVHQVGIAQIVFFNLAFDTGWPNYVGAHQAVKNPVIALGQRLRRKTLNAPLVFHADVDIFELLVGGEIAGFHGLRGDFIS